MKHLKIACFGAGYVGGPTMAVMACKSPENFFVVYDPQIELIAKWNSLKPPVYELGLEDLLKQTLNKNLFFTTNCDVALENVQIIFICVNTPTKNSGEGAHKAPDLQFLENVVREIARFFNEKRLEKPVIIVEKSTVPVSTCKFIKEILRENQRKFKENREMFVVLSNPDSAVQDLLFPDRVLLGSENTEEIQRNAVEQLRNLYESWVPKEKIIYMNIFSSELSKIVANSFLAQRISSINSISAICEKVGADIQEISLAIGKDSRIGNKFLNSSVGFGGSCLKKDLLSLIYLSEHLGLSEVAEYWSGVLQMNEYQKQRFARIIINRMYGNVNGKNIAIFGVSFKKNTNDTRESPALLICHALLQENAKLAIYDPKTTFSQFAQEMEIAGFSLEKYRNSAVSWNSDAYSAAKNSHAIVVLTDWDEFCEVDYREIHENMARPAFFFDGRCVSDIKKLEEIGFLCYQIGKKSLEIG